MRWSVRKCAKLARLDARRCEAVRRNARCLQGSMRGCARKCMMLAKLQCDAMSCEAGEALRDDASCRGPDDAEMRGDAWR